MSKVYTTEYLVDRLYDELSKNTNSLNKSKMILTKPEVCFVNKKSIVSNFRDICQKIKRSEQEVKNYFESELKIQTTIDNNGYLIMNGSFKQNGVQNVLVNYIKDYILCKECGSHDTQIIKENRIQYLDCSKCLSRKAL